MDREKYYLQRNFEFYYNFVNPDLSKPDNISDYTHAYCIVKIARILNRGLKLYKVDGSYKLSKPIQKLLDQRRKSRDKHVKLESN